VALIGEGLISTLEAAVQTVSDAPQGLKSRRHQGGHNYLSTSGKGLAILRGYLSSWRATFGLLLQLTNTTSPKIALAANRLRYLVIGNESDDN
jgi:hypothetical protein